MEAPIKKPKPKKPRKPRKPRKPSKPSTGTNITINVGTPSSRAPRRARAPAKPKVDPTANQFGFRSPGAGGGGGGGVLPSFAGQGDQFRQVIYTPQGDVSGSIKALEKSIDNLSRASGSKKDDESEAQRQAEEEVLARLARGGLGSGGGGGKTGSNRVPNAEETEQAKADALRRDGDILTAEAIGDLRRTPIGQQKGAFGSPAGTDQEF